MMASMAAKVGGAAGGGLTSMVGDLLGVKTTGALFIGVLKSRTVQNALVQQFDLKTVYGKSLVEKARLRLDQNTSISEDRKSGIITIAVTDRSPQRAAALAKAYVDELNSLVAGLSTSSARREREFLEERLKVVKQGLDDSTNQLAQFSSNNSTLDLENEAKAMLDAAANLEGQLVAAQSELEGLRQIYTDNNSRVQVLKARIAELKKEVGKFSGTNDIGGKQGSQPPNSTGGIPFPSIRSLPLLGVKYADYYRSAKIQETVYELLTQQYEIAKVQEAKETPTVKVLDAALIPEEKSFPPRGIIIMVGTSIIFVVCVIWVLAVERWKDVDARDPRKIFIEEVVEKAKLRVRRLSNRHGLGA
jgi:capsule polysaccharide export protein KpsE/RkpR